MVAEAQQDRMTLTTLVFHFHKESCNPTVAGKLLFGGRRMLPNDIVKGLVYKSNVLIKYYIVFFYSFPQENNGKDRSANSLDTSV